MSQQRLIDSLTNLYATHAVVFWHDVDAEFSTAVDDLQLDGVQLIRLDDTPALRIKLDIARAPKQNWLIYSNQPEPESGFWMCVYAPKLSEPIPHQSCWKTWD